MTNLFEALACANKICVKGTKLLQLSAAVMALVAGGAMVGPGAAAQSVTGEVTDAQKTVTFEGATVRIEGLPRSTTTDNRGRFRLANVQPGSYTLVISYVGTQDTRIPIEVDSDGLAMGEVIIGGDIDEMEVVIVIGQSAAAANALSQERSADNLVSALDTDAMGQFPDQNVAEALRRLSGVSVENDQGEGRYVIIRGMDPDLNSTSINGMSATSAEPRRALQLDVIPSDILDGLEVHKTLTPDMDGDAIGGAVNVKTLSAFSRKGPYFKARAEEQYNEQREKLNPKLSVAGSNIIDVSDEKRLGIAGGMSWNDRHLLVNNNEADDWDVADNGSDFVEEFEPRLYTIDRERFSAVLNFDLDLSDFTTLHLYSLYSRFEDNEIRNRVTFGLGGLDESTVSDVSADYSEAELERDIREREETAENVSITFGSETQLTDWLIETNLGYSYARERTPNGILATWAAEYESGDGLIPEDAPVLTLNRGDAQTPIIESDFFAALQDASRYELDEIESARVKNEDEQFSLKLDTTRSTKFGAIKMGAKVRLREKTSNEDVQIFSGDGTFFLSDVPTSSGSEYGFPTPIGPAPLPAGAHATLDLGDGLEFEELDSTVDSNVADFIYNEDTYAIYGMGIWDTGKLAITTGIRVEHTEIESKGNEVEIIEEGTVVDGDPLEDDTAFVSSLSATNSYTDILPSVNIRYEFNEVLVGRASAYRSVVRPRIEDAAFRVEIEDNEASLGNPDLKPFRAWNLDASLAHYPTKLSVISGGVFYKRIEDFVFVQTLDDFEFQDRVFDEATIALNGESAEVLGVELTYQQHFGFLSEPFDGLLVAVNYTYVDSEGDVGDRKVDLPKQSANLGSFMLGYDKYGFDIRLAMKYRDRSIDELEEAGLDRYTDTHLQWDLTVKYRVSDNWQIYSEVTNLGDEPEYHYAGRRSRLLQYDEFGTSATLGVQYNF